MDLRAADALMAAAAATEASEEAGEIIRDLWHRKPSSAFVFRRRQKRRETGICQKRKSQRNKNVKAKSRTKETLQM